MMKKLEAPPQVMIDHALLAAEESPCAKSKRGVVLYRTDGFSPLFVTAYNGPPAPFLCAAGAACRTPLPVATQSACSMVAVHAEQRAIREAIYVERADTLPGWAAVHVKYEHGRGLVASGGPSCWQCAREVMDVKLGAFFLYEEHPRGFPVHPSAVPAWVRYDAEEFYTATLFHEGLLR